MSTIRVLTKGGSMKELWPSLLRLIRVAVAQAIGAIIASTTGITIPYVGLSIGAILNALSKYLRDKFPAWAEWLPV